MHSKTAARTTSVPARTLPAIVLILYLIGLPGWQTSAQNAPALLPTVTTARAAHQLDARQASRAYPVRLRAVVTFYDEYLDSTGTPVLFVTDATGSIYVALKVKPVVRPRPGDLVEIDGVTGPGLFAPIVDHARFTVLGTAPLPAHPPRVILSDMVNGRYEGQWVEVEGLVQAVRDSGPHVVLDLLLRDGTTTAITSRQPGVDYSYLVDAGIILHGHASPNFNKQKQVTGAHLLFPDLSAVTVVQPGVPDPFNLPVDRISGLLRFDPERTFQHRVHIRGTLTLLWPGRTICIEDAGQGLCASTQQSEPLALGETVDLVGFPSIGPFTPTLDYAEYRDAGLRQPVEPVPTTPGEALHGDRDALLITVEGWVIDDNHHAEDRILTLSSGDSIFTVTIPVDASLRKPPLLEDHTRVRVTGICSVASGGTQLGTGEGFSIPKSFSILARSRADVTVMQQPPWWNAERSRRVLTFATACILITLGVIFLLRRRVKQQTATIRAQLAETHALKEAAEFQATHDGLTGLFNRKAIFDLLHREFSRAARSGLPIGIIMLDLDHFKQINDTYGHSAGDDVLKESVRRILGALRTSDLVGRYGGEEFLIVLPECGRDEVKACAERIRSAISACPTSAQGEMISVTASLGATVANASLHLQQDAISTADHALYDSKHSGRNRTSFHDLGAHSQAKRLPASEAAPGVSRIA
jgi:diguanylate cyclase (GGDEF)-like protein